ncbi:MAG TPA: hypothetical protein VG407_12535 [Caulobacteraceae bacterium]|nr:hypothetical protein [Caulobacteraceae bacterium]
MTEALRTILQLALAGAMLTAIAMAAGWWFETARRLKRNLRHVLGGAPDAIAVDPADGRAAAIRFDSRQLAVLWDKGASGLVYHFQEIDGAELIVDGHVSARVARGEARKALDAVDGDAGQVTLRLIFADARFPEFELDLWGVGSAHRPDSETPADAVRSGRRWLSHVDAVIKRSRAKAKPRDEAFPEEDDGQT